jgi:pyrrolysine biosynthesis protein PylD
MTRLTEPDITGIVEKLPAHDADLTGKTSLSLREIAMHTADMAEKAWLTAVGRHRVAVIPVTSGQGIIGNFTSAVKGILAYLGVNAFVTEASDVAGLAESIEREASIAILADDNRFIALNFALKRLVDNAEATAMGYVSALVAMARERNSLEVLVVGAAGRVGWSAVRALSQHGAQVAVIDLNRKKIEALVKGYEIRVETDLNEALSRYTMVFDASPAAGIIRAEHIKPETLIAAPGIPLGVSEDAFPLVKGRLVHDALEIGVATMFVQATCVS